MSTPTTPNSVLDRIQQLFQEIGFAKSDALEKFQSSLPEMLYLVGVLRGMLAHADELRGMLAHADATFEMSDLEKRAVMLAQEERRRVRERVDAQGELVMLLCVGGPADGSWAMAQSTMPEGAHTQIGGCLYTLREGRLVAAEKTPAVSACDRP